MLTTTILALSSLLTPLLASPAPAPLPAPPKKTQTTYTVKYDDLPWIEGNANPIPPHYYGLSYAIFQVDQYDGFISPTSGNQYAMAFGGSGNISIPDSPPKQTFTLQSFHYACSSGVPQPECAISVWGWRKGKVAARRTLKFPRLDPGHVIEDFVMNYTTFDSHWRDLESIGFSIARADNGGDMFGGLMLDDVRYTVNNCA